MVGEGNFISSGDAGLQLEGSEAKIGACELPVESGCVLGPRAGNMGALLL